MTYLELGLVPPSHYPWEDRGSLKRCLETLDPVARRKACRKFRKISRGVRVKSQGHASFHTKQTSVKYKIQKEHMRTAPSDNDE